MWRLARRALTVALAIGMIVQTLLAGGPTAGASVRTTVTGSSDAAITALLADIKVVNCHGGALPAGGDSEVPALPDCSDCTRCSKIVLALPAPPPSVPAKLGWVPAMPFQDVRRSLVRFLRPPSRAPPVAVWFL